ncbi:malate dehydrogenase, partial [Mycobacterium tuberculosis]|nr:malate dehydrogenase [Mycobacterium tuberculosis]
PDLDSRNFTAMTRLDHNRGMAQLAEETETTVNDIKKMIIWGNHSSTQYPDLTFTTVKGQPALEQVQRDWYEGTYI